MNKLIYTAVALALSATSAQALVIESTTTDGSVLVNEILGSGINVTAGTISYNGVTGQSGLFSDGLASGIGMDSGIILTTGSATTAVGPNTSDSTSIGTGSGGDADLTALTGSTTFDSAVLEFQFTSDGGDLFFEFVFASEEYNEYVGTQFNDAFALFVDGVNIALAPDGQPVVVNNVNCGNPFGTGGPNCAYYNNNDINDGGPFFNVGYDGFTDVFTAQALNLAAGNHTMKFAIADTSDSSWDSAVFIKAGSFSDTDEPPIDPPIDAPEPSSLLLLGLGLFGLGYSRKKARS
jgi:hypothetical protein